MEFRSNTASIVDSVGTRQPEASVLGSSGTAGEGDCAEGRRSRIRFTLTAGDKHPTADPDRPRREIAVLPQVVNYGILPYQRLRSALVPCVHACLPAACECLIASGRRTKEDVEYPSTLSREPNERDASWMRGTRCLASVGLGCGARYAGSLWVALAPKSAVHKPNRKARRSGAHDPRSLAEIWQDPAHRDLLYLEKAGGDAKANGCRWLLVVDSALRETVV